MNKTLHKCIINEKKIILQLMFDQYNVCEYNDSNVIILLRREL